MEEDEEFSLIPELLLENPRKRRTNPEKWRKNVEKKKKRDERNQGCVIACNHSGRHFCQLV